MIGSFVLIAHRRLSMETDEELIEKLQEIQILIVRFKNIDAYDKLNELIFELIDECGIEDKASDGIF